MRSGRRLLFVIIVVFGPTCVVAMPLANTAFATVGKLPSEALSALQRNVTELLPLEVTWERSRVPHVPVEHLLKKIKYGQMSTGEMRPYKVRFLCDTGKLYAHTWRYSAHVDFVNGKASVNPSKPMHLVEEETSFDGEIYYVGNVMDQQVKAGTNPLLEKMPVSKASSIRRYFNPDYLYWAGFKLPRTSSELAQNVRSTVLGDLDQSAIIALNVKAESVDGVPSCVVEIKSMNREIQYRLDPTKNYAVSRRIEKTTDGRLLTDAACFDFVKLGNRELWLAQHIRVSWYTWETIPESIEPEPLLTEEFRLLEWKTNPIPASQFALNYNIPGTMVKDYVVAGSEKFTGGAVSYRIPADPSDLDNVIATAVHGTIPRKRYGWLFIINLCVLLVVGAVVVVRRAKRQQQAN